MVIRLDDPSLIDLRTAATLLHKSYASTWRYVNEGRLAAILVGGIWHTTPQACQEFADACTADRLGSKAQTESKSKRQRRVNAQLNAMGVR